MKLIIHCQTVKSINPKQLIIISKLSFDHNFLPQFISQSFPIYIQLGTQASFRSLLPSSLHSHILYTAQHYQGSNNVNHFIHQPQFPHLLAMHFLKTLLFYDIVALFLVLITSFTSQALPTTFLSLLAFTNKSTFHKPFSLSPINHSLQRLKYLLSVYLVYF